MLKAALAYVLFRHLGREVQVVRRYHPRQTLRGAPGLNPVSCDNCLSWTLPHQAEVTVPAHLVILTPKWSSDLHIVKFRMGRTPGIGWDNG